ncbi:MAG TPA: DUF58 domain-containing protein [Xanthobacteraceae bacterium]|jgi:uncharacterized protein (DUF58 family)
MGLSLAALHRTKGIRTRPRPTDTSAGVYATVGDLAALKHAARDFSFLPRQPIHSLLSGRHGSRVRGRGLAFEELRQYFPGDDIRTMDWRVTARTGKPFVRVYAEEKDRPALFLVDQRINMFFGTRRAMKSVAAAEVAALGVWRVLAQDDRVGGFVFNDERIDEVRPHRSENAVMRFLETIATQNAALSADSPARRNQAQLDAVLDAAAQVADHDHLVIIASDFDGHGPHTRDLLLRLAAHNDVLAVLVYDPFLVELPSALELVVSDGELQVELGRGARKSVFDYAHGYGKTILAWEREIGVPVLPLSAAEETAPQIRRLLGQAAGRRRR